MVKKPSTVLSQLQTNPGLLAGGVAAGLVGGGLLLACLAVVAVIKRRH